MHEYYVNYQAAVVSPLPLPMDIKDKVGVNQIGWEALWHTDGWWVGTDKGVTCYSDHEIARAALTIAVQREGGRMVFRIRKFTGATVATGEHTPRKSAEEVIKEYEAKSK